MLNLSRTTKPREEFLLAAQQLSSFGFVVHARQFGRKGNVGHDLLT
jgi:hypothetical protein